MAQERGRLVAVRAGGDAAASAIELVGDRPLSFTTLKLRGPPRVVVDFAETDLALRDRALAVDDGTIRRVAAAPAGQKTARVVIELAGEAEFTVRAHGSTVEVRVPRIAPLVALAEPPPKARTQADAAGRAAERPGPEGAPLASGTAAPAATDSGAVAGGRAPPAAGPQEGAPLAEPGGERAPLAEPGGSRAGTAAQESPGAAERGESEDRPGTVADKVPAAPQAAPPRRSAADKAAERTRVATEKKAGQQRAAAEKAARRSAGEHARARPDRKVAVAARHAITGIGFRPVGGGEVIVRSDHPLEYGVSADGAAVVIHLPGAGIPLLNNRRPLDTRFFDGPVQRVVPLAAADGTDLRIELSGKADYQLAQSGGVLTVTFSASR